MVQIHVVTKKNCGNECGLDSALHLGRVKDDRNSYKEDRVTVKLIWCGQDCTTAV